MPNPTEEVLNRNKDILLEALRENWTSARYHESTRWKYFYYYFAAVGGILVYFAKGYLDGSFILSVPCASQLLFIALISFILGAVGYIALGHLIYANAEYGNHIRAIEYIARDLGLNCGIEKYRKERERDFNVEAYEIKAERSTYMALPLHLEIRGKLGNINLYIWFISILFSISFYSIILFIKDKNLPFLFLNNSLLICSLFGLVVVCCLATPGCYILKLICNKYRFGQVIKDIKSWALLHFAIIIVFLILFLTFPENTLNLNLINRKFLNFSLIIWFCAYVSLKYFVWLKHRLVKQETDARDPRKIISEIR
jgi:hypothetical protein